MQGRRLRAKITPALHPFTSPQEEAIMTLTDPFFSQYCTPKAEIAASLRVLFRRGDCFEIRVIDAQGSNKTDVGYFDDCRTAAASVVARYDGKTPAVYVVLNEMPHDMLARSANAFG